MLFHATIVFANTYEIKTIFPQSPNDYYFYDASAVAVDFQKFVYIADEKNHRIIKYTNDGRFIKQWGVKGSDKGQFNRVKDIVFDRKQSLYAVDSNNNRIQQFTLDGEFVHSWGASRASKENSDINDEGSLYIPHSITIDKNGYIYVADTFKSRIQKFTENGVFISTWNYDKQLNEPVGLAACSHEIDTCLYVLERSGATSGRLLKLLADKKINECDVDVLLDVNTSTPDSSGYTQEDYNAHISTDSSGLIYIPERNIFTVDPVQQVKNIWGEYGDALNQFQRPVGIKVVQEEIYVTDWDKDCVRKFSKQGELLNYWGFQGNAPDQLNTPYGIAYSYGLIYVADTGNDRIQIFNDDGHFIKTIGKDLNKPTDIVCHSDGTIYVADQKNKRIQSINSLGTINNFSCSGFPDRIDIDSSGYLYVSSYVIVSDRKKYQIEKVNIESSYSTVFTCGLPDSYSLDTLQDIAVTQDGYTIYAIFQGRNEVLQFNTEGDYLDTWIPEKDQSLAAISVDLTNNLFLEFTNTIKKYSPNKKMINEFSVLKLDQERLLRRDTRRGFCVSGNKVYLSDDYSRIQVFGPKSNIVNKAIIIAGSSNNTFWDLIQLQANMAYQTLIQKQWKKENIKYLSSDINIDLDNNDKSDDVNAKPTKVNFKKAITDWSKNADFLVIYMVGHGGSNKFRLNDESVPYTSVDESTQYDNILHSDELHKWLDELQKINSHVTIVIICDADDSGNFISSLQSVNRIIISSTSQNQTAIFPDTASLSFSSVFWRSISLQKTIKNAFLDAEKTFVDLGVNQRPQIDANANAKFCEYSDLQEANIHLNGEMIQNEHFAANEIPIIEDNVEWHFSTDQSLLTLTANQITSTRRIDRVFALMLPLHSEKKGVDYPVIEFKLTGGNLQEKHYTGSYVIDHSGMYRIVMYARDAMFALSEPQILTISVSTSKTKQAIIIAGQTEAPYIQSCYDSNARMAYNALKFQGYTDNDIYLLSNSNIANVDNPLTSENIYNYLKGANKTTTKEILIYIIGEGDYQSFHLNETKELKASELDQWINSSIDHILIYDACMGKSFIQELAMNSEDGNRILIASSQLIEPAYYLFQGELSFSRLFWSQVNNGLSTRDSFQYATSNFVQLKIGQCPVILDQNNGSSYHYIGTGLKQMPDQPLTGKARAMIKNNDQLFLEVSNVSTTNSINNVWAVIIPVDKHLSDFTMQQTNCPVSCMSFKEVLLNSHADADIDCYSANTIIELEHSGEYDVHFLSMDNNGRLSTVKTISVYQNTGEDFYEPDNQESTANIININDPEPQQHSLHEKSDIDIFKFFGRKDKIYEINVVNIDKSKEHAVYMEIYNYKEWIKLDEGILPISKQWKCPEDNDYLIKLRYNVNQTFNEACGYYISIFEKDASLSDLLIMGQVLDKFTKKIIREVEVHSEYCYTIINEKIKSGNFAIFCQNNNGKNITLTFVSENYQKSEFNFTPTEDEIWIDQLMSPLFTIEASTSLCCGKVSPGSTQMAYGETQTYRIIPRDCYLIQDVTIDDVSVGPISMYTFTNVNENHNINAAFKSYRYFSVANLISMMRTISGKADKPICQLYRSDYEIFRFENISDLIEVMQYIAAHEGFNTNEE